MNYQFLLAIVVIFLMVCLLISNIVANKKCYREIKELRESLEAGNTLRDKVLTTISNIEEKLQQDFREHIGILELIRKNTNKKDMPKKDFKKPNNDKKPRNTYNGQTTPDNK